MLLNKYYSYLTAKWYYYYFYYSNPYPGQIFLLMAVFTVHNHGNILVLEKKNDDIIYKY